MSSSKPRARAIVEGMAVCAAVAVCAAPGLGKVEAVGVTMGVAVSLCLFAWEGVRAPPRGATEEEEVEEAEEAEAEAEAAGEAVPGAWLQALRVEGAPDFSKFASDDENESNPRTPERLLRRAYFHGHSSQEPSRQPPLPSGTRRRGGMRSF